MINLAEDPTLLAPKAMSFQFKTNKKMYSATVHFSKKNFVPVNGKKPIVWAANVIPVEIGKRFCRWSIQRVIDNFYFDTGLNGGQGKGIAVCWYATSLNSLPITTDNSCRHFLTPTETKPDNRLTVMFSEDEAKSLLVSGGKGASLALLSSIQIANFDEKDVAFVVPQGFIVSVSAFDLQVGRNPNLSKLIKSIKDVAYGITDGKLQDVCER